MRPSGCGKHLVVDKRSSERTRVVGVCRRSRQLDLSTCQQSLRDEILVRDQPGRRSASDRRAAHGSGKAPGAEATLDGVPRDGTPLRSLVDAQELGHWSDTVDAWLLPALPYVWKGSLDDPVHCWCRVHASLPRATHGDASRCIAVRSEHLFWPQPEVFLLVNPVVWFHPVGAHRCDRDARNAHALDPTRASLICTCSVHRVGAVV